MIDPLVSLSTAIASRNAVWSLACAAIILLVCVLIPRGFCGYLCPLGTTIDLFDWLIAGRTKRFRVPGEGWWVHIKYYLLAGTLVAAVGGVLLSGVFSAIPIITRAMLFLGDPLQSGMAFGSTDRFGAIRFDRTICRSAWIRFFASAILVQVCLPKRCRVFAGQLISSDRAKGGVLVHQLQQVCCGFPRVRSLRARMQRGGLPRD